MLLTHMNSREIIYIYSYYYKIHAFLSFCVLSPDSFTFQISKAEQELHTISRFLLQMSV